jgi:hypothetical protein
MLTSLQFTQLKGASHKMRFFQNKIAFAATSALFALAVAWNVSQGSNPFTGNLSVRAQVETVAHGPSLPPDPWTGGSSLVAHGPMLPPDPWSGSGSSLVAHGPMLPPDPWSGSGSSLAA